MSFRLPQQQTNRIEELSEHLQVLVFSFLSLRDQAIASLVNRRWFAISQSPAIWRRVSYDYLDGTIADPVSYTAWFTKRLSDPSLHIHELTINDSSENFTASQIAEIFQQPRLHLETLKLSLYHLSETEQCLLSLLLVKSCPNLKSFCTHGNFLSDTTMEFFPLLTHLIDLRVLSSSPDFTGIHLQALPQLQKLYLLPYMIDFNHLHRIISKSCEALRELAIDTEHLTNKQILTIIDLLPKGLLTTLKFSYCEYFDDEVFARLADFAELTNLKFYKASEVSKSAYINCFRSFKSTSLLELNLKECNELCDEGLIQILAKSSQLRVIRLAWQRDITSKSIYFMFTNCPFISLVSFLGVKQLNAHAFPYIADVLPLFNSKKYAQLRRASGYQDKYNNDCVNNQLFAQANIDEYFHSDAQALKERVDCYKSLRFIDCTKSDLVPDEALQVLHLLNSMLTALNYYGEKM